MSSRITLLALPGAILLGAAAWAFGFGDPVLSLQLSYTLAYGALAVALLLAWRFHSTRLFAAGLLVGAALLVLQPGVLGTSDLARVLFASFLPPGIALLTFAMDRGFTVTRLRNQLVLAVAPLAAAAFLSAGNPAHATKYLTTEFVDPIYTEWSGLPQIALLIVVLAVSAAAGRTIMVRRPPDAGLTWLTLALACAVAAPAGSVTSAIWVLAGGLVMITALIESAYAMAFYDELTGLPGRRALAQALHALQAPYAIAIVDVDHFKSFNDRHGHDVGDQVLRMVAARLRTVTGGGAAFRSGGEEFTIVFPGLSKREALPHAEAVREAVATSRFALRKLPRPRGKNAPSRRGRGAAAAQLQVTISVGIAAPTARSATVESVLEKADQAMYRAKHEGRNRVEA